MLETWLRKEYGLLIDSAAIAQILGYRSANSLAKARSRGVVEIEMFRLPNRQGLYTSPRHLAAYLQAKTGVRVNFLMRMGESAL